MSDKKRNTFFHLIFYSCDKNKQGKKFYFFFIKQIVIVFLKKKGKKCFFPQKIIFFFDISTFSHAGRREKRLFLRQKKSTIFFHARISSSGKEQVSDFSAMRVRVEGVGSPRVARGEK
jgi:hypothetical protein